MPLTLSRYFFSPTLKPTIMRAPFIPHQFHFPQLKLFFASLGFIFVISLLTSCSKENIQISEGTESSTKYDAYYKILTFLEMKEGKTPTHPILIPRTTYSPDDVVYYIEGGMNLAYTDAGLSWQSYESRIDTFTLTLSAGYASQQNLDNLFDEIRDSASVHFYSISDPDKFPIIYDATKIATTSSLLTIRFMSRIGKGHRDPTPFGSTDYWSVYGGKCSPYSGGTLDASQVIANALNDYYAPYGCTFYTDVVTAGYVELLSYGWGQVNTNDNNPGDFIQDYKTWKFFCWDYGSYGDPEEYSCNAVGFPDCAELTSPSIHCLDPDNMNFYFQSIRNIYDSYLANQSNPYLVHKLSEIDFANLLCLEVSQFWLPTVSFGVPNECADPGDYPTYLPPCCP